MRVEVLERFQHPSITKREVPNEKKRKPNVSKVSDLTANVLKLLFADRRTGLSRCHQQELHICEKSVCPLQVPPKPLLYVKVPMTNLGAERFSLESVPHSAGNSNISGFFI